MKPVADTFTDAADPVTPRPVDDLAVPVTAPVPAPGDRFARWTALVTLLGAINLFVGLGTNSIARDEGFSISTSLRSWSSLAKLSIHTETNAWLYAFALKAWSALGTSPAMLRVPSALAMVAAIPLTALVARRLFGDRVALLAAGAVAANGAVLMFAQQVRTYGFAVALALAAMVAFLAEVTRPSRRNLVLWVVLVALTAQTQLHTVTIFVPQLIALAALPAAQRQWRRRVGALAVGLVIVSPVPIIISRHEEGQGLFSLRLGVFRDVLYTFTGRGGVPGVLVFGVAGLVLLGLTRRAWDGPDAWRRFGLVLVLAWVAVPFLMLFGASLVLQPTLIGRYLLFCVPAMAIALGLAADLVLRQGWKRSLAIAAVVVLGAGAARGSVSWHVDSKTEHWDEVAAYVFANARATDRLVVANDSIQLFFTYERTRQGAPPAGPQPGYPAGVWGSYQTGDQRYDSPTADELAVATKDAPRVWVVIGRHHVNTEVMPDRLKALDASFRLVETRSFPVDIDVLLYERTA